jgi:hypothetical protein
MTECVDFFDYILIMLIGQSHYQNFCKFGAFKNSGFQPETVENRNYKVTL